MAQVKLSFIRQFALTTALIMAVGWVGYFIGKHEVRSYGDVVTGLKEEVTLTEPSGGISRTGGRQDVDMTMFWAVWDQLEETYIFEDQIDYDKMVYGAIEGMTSALGDPYTAFYPPADNQTSKENLSGSFFGVGIQLGYKRDQLAVIAPISGMPAEKVGVQSGDYILKIVDEANGVDVETYNISILEAVQYIRGEKNTPVKLTLLREGAGEPYEVEILREEIVVPSVEVEFGRLTDTGFDKENPGDGDVVAHLRLTRFGELTELQWNEAIDAILARGSDVKGVVLDVRNNPGGYMQSAIDLSAEFLPVGSVVVKQEHSQYPTQEFKVERSGRLLKTPLVVLVNQGSASASEIVAGALRDHNRAELIGVTSFGKGTIQSSQDLSGGAGLHVTIARWLTPNNNWVHEKGLEPDFEIVPDTEDPTNDVQLFRAAQRVVGLDISQAVNEVEASEQIEL
jgi:carboxyl-terminal processing protease